MNRPLLHDEIARHFEAQPHEDASSYDDSHIVDRWFKRACLIAAILITAAYVIADWRLDARFHSASAAHLPAAGSTTSTVEASGVGRAK
jgi:hypothetical protein